MEANHPKYIVLHCTDCSYKQIPDQFVACNGWHKDRGFPLSSLGLYIGYHRLITGDLNYKCRLDTDEGAHCNQHKDGVSMNFQSLGICIGFDGDIEFPTPVQQDLLQKQIWAWQDQYGISNDKVFFHRDFATDKTCPGSLITKQWLSTILNRATVPQQKQNQCIEENATIQSQKEKISWLSNLVDSLMKFINKK